MCAQLLNRVHLFCDPTDCSPLSMGILQARILKLPCPPPGDLPYPGIELESPAGGLFTTEPPGNSQLTML